MTTITGTRITSGSAEAAVLKLDEPVSFWGGVGPEGTIIDVHHPQHGATVTGRVLVMRTGRGSSSGTYVLAELIRLGLAPAGIILTEPDGIIATGALVAAELYDTEVPIAVISASDYELIEDGVTVALAMESDQAVVTLT